MNEVFDGKMYETGTASVTIPEGVTRIDDEAFFGCEKLETVTIPASLRTIGRHAFCHCPKLREFVVALASPSFVFENGFLLTKDRRRLIRALDPVGNVTIPAGVEEIEVGAFSHCERMTSVTFPEGVRTLWADAFESCHALTSMTIPRSLKLVYYDAYYDCPLLKTMRVASDDVSRVRTLLEEWAAADVNCNFTFEEMNDGT